MLPNLKLLVCGILFCFLLFAAAGTGVMLPDARTHVGEMPEIGRPMMQRSMAEAPAQAGIYMMAAARRSDEPERLGELAPMDTVAPSPPEPDSGKPELSKSLSKPDLVRPDLPAPDSESREMSEGTPIASPALAGSPGADGVPTAQTATLAPLQMPNQPLQVPVVVAPPPAADTRTDVRVEAGSPQVVALALPTVEDSEPVRRLAKVPLPPPRPALLLRQHVRVFHRRHRVAQQQDTVVQGVPASQGVAPTGRSSLFTSPP
jgi:hypothetical protein